MVCAMMHCLAWIYSRGAQLHPYIPYYNRAAALTCAAPGAASGIWYMLEMLRRCDTLQRDAGDVISAFAGLVLYAVEWVKLPETHL